MIINEWPCLKTTNGHQLLEIDFGHNYKEKQLKLFEKWPYFQKNGTRLMEDVNIGANLKEMFKADNENERDFALCSALPIIIKPTTKVLNSVNKKLKKVSMAESRQAFITHVDNYADVGTRKVAEQTQKL